MKLERKALATYLDSTMGGTGTPTWFLLGVDIEEMAVELNPDVETVKNIIGETSVKDNGYEPQMTADPYYANTTDSIYEPIKNIAMNRITGDGCKTKILEVIIEDNVATSHEAYMEDVVIKPQSYGGDTSGMAIPFDVYFNGNRTAGTVTITAGVPAFTPSGS